MDSCGWNTSRVAGYLREKQGVQMNMLYCVRCEEMVKVEKGLVVGHIEHIQTNDYPPVEMDFCDLPDGWATTPPPEIPEYWSDYVQDAQENEMELSWIGAQDFIANLQ